MGLPACCSRTSEQGREADEKWAIERYLEIQSETIRLSTTTRVPAPDGNVALTVAEIVRLTAECVRELRWAVAISDADGL